MSNSVLEIGALAPDFRLFSADKAEIALSDYRGKQNVLLLFLPLAFTGVCMGELCSLRDDFSQYADSDTAVLAVFPDSIFVLEQVKNQHQVNYPLLSDFNREVAVKYGAQFAEFPVFGMRNVPKRSAFVIDKQGVLRYQEIKEVPQELPDFVKIVELLRSLH